MRTLSNVIVVGALLGLLACNPDRFTEPMTFAGEEISAEVIEHGYEQYMLNCYACHGEEGDGNGPAAAYLRPPPRDFRAAVFKFGGVSAGQLPHTKDLVRLVKRGLTGTAMLPWDLPDSDLEAIIQYIKTFSAGPEDDDNFSNLWQDPDEELGERIVPTEDTWKGKDAEAVAYGEKIYHVTAMCNTCHPSYVSKEQLYNYTKEIKGTGTTTFSDGMYRSSLRDSDYGVKILPIDFLYHSIKTLHPDDTKREQLDQLYVTIGAGIGGTAMPRWQGSLSEKDLWSLAYYIQDVYEKRDTAEGNSLRAALLNQGPFVAPEEVPAEPEEAPASTETK